MFNPWSPGGSFMVQKMTITSPVSGILMVKCVCVYIRIYNVCIYMYMCMYVYMHTHKVCFAFIACPMIGG